MKHVLSRLFIVLLAYLTIFPAHAQNSNVGRWYEVEIILFEHLKPVTHNPEQWPIQAGQVDFENSITLEQDPTFNMPWLKSLAVGETRPEILDEETVDEGARKLTEMPTPYLILPKEHYQLNASYQRLYDSTDYLPLLHIAWQQSMSARTSPDRILLDDQIDEAKVEPYPPLLIQADNHFDLSSYDNAKTAQKNLRGILSLSIARYLHIETDFLFHKPTPSNKPPQAYWKLPKETLAQEANYTLSPLLSIEEAEPEFFRIKGKLRMRSREIHYLDHPLVGMLILFTPVELPEEVLEEEENNSELGIETTPKQDSGFQVIQDDSF